MKSKNKVAPSVLLTIAGLDPSSGAGLSADLKVFAAHGVFGVSCPTALTVQSTRGVERSEPVSAQLVTDTLRCLENDLPIDGVKIGMLGNTQVLRAVAAWLRTRKAQNSPVVLDPVLRASAGAALLETGALDAFREEILPLATIVTPNTEELARLTGRQVESREAVPEAARALQLLPGCAGLSVLVTGGHLSGSPDDYLLPAGAEEGVWLRGEWIETQATHGTGCALSSALLCGLVAGLAPEWAARQAKEYVSAAMRAAYPLGHGRGPMHHLFMREDRTQG